MITSRFALSLALVASISLFESFPLGTGSSTLPGGIDIAGLPVVVQVAGIVLATLLSEDVTCIAIGLLIRHGGIEWWVGGIGCLLGIYCGDLLFFLLGRWGGSRILNSKFFSRGFGPERLAAFGDWFDRRPWAAIAMCRVMPGIRVPLYLAVGALTKRTAAFFWWTCFFAFIWTPILIALVVLFGEQLTHQFDRITGGRFWISFLLAIATVYLTVRFAMLLSNQQGREHLAGRFGFLWGRKKRPADDDPLLSGGADKCGGEPPAKFEDDSKANSLTPSS